MGPPESAEGDSSRTDISRAWTRAGEVQSPRDDDGMLPFDDLHFHHYCAVWPFKPDDDPALTTDRSDRDPSDIRFLSGITRTGLRHTPLVILVTTVVFFGSAELSPEIEGVSVFVPPLSIPLIAGILAVGLLYLALLLVVIRTEIISFRELYKATVVFGLLAFLLVGTVVSIAAVVFDPSIASDRNIVFTSGYLLMLLVAGLLVYDGMLRTEHMFETLDAEEHQIVDDRERYDAFKRRLVKDFEHRIVDTAVTIGGRTFDLRLPTSHLFAALFLSQYAIAWSIGIGPQNLDFPVTLWGNVLLNLFIVIVFFQFMVLMNRFYGLITDDLGSSSAGSALTYVPFHPDGRGGYRDFGKFATRVNLLLILAGFYTLYRLVVQGSRVTPAEMAPGFEPLVGNLIWTASFLIPLGVYAIAAFGWFYYSFWQLHLRMLRERERSYRTTTESFDDGADWEIQTEGPTWPTDFNQLVSLVSGTFAPIILILLEAFR